MNNVEQYMLLKAIDKNPGISRQSLIAKGPYNEKSVYNYHLDTLAKVGWIYKYNTIQFKITDLGKTILDTMNKEFREVIRSY